MQDLSQDSHLLKTTANSISAFSMAFSNYLDSIRINGLKNTVVKLTSALKQYNKEDIVEPIVKESFCNFSLTRGWMSNGIWNTSCMEHFKSKFIHNKNNKSTLILNLILFSIISFQFCF